MGTFSIRRLVSDPGVDRAASKVGDIDGDGDLDVVSISDSELEWYENVDSVGTYGALYPIDRFDETRRSTVELADFDYDGDFDVIIGLQPRSLRGGLDPSSRQGVTWYENDGQGGFADPLMISTNSQSIQDLYDLAPVDFDLDGEMDVVAASFGDGKISWFEPRVVGDSNNYGVFDSSDLIAVLQRGKYEDGLPRSASYDDGDWNNDGDFDSNDLIFVLEAGTYNSQSHRLAVQLDAAIDWAFGCGRPDR